jgi:hypothetical protein
MDRRLSIGPDGCAVEGGAGLSFARLVTFAPAVVVALALTMAALGGAFIGRQGSSWTPTWGTIADNTTSQPSSGLVSAGENEASQSARANDDGYVEGLARALGYASVEEMARAEHPQPSSRPQPPSNLVHR